MTPVHRAARALRERAARGGRRLHQRRERARGGRHGLGRARHRRARRHRLDRPGPRADAGVALRDHARRAAARRLQHGARPAATTSRPRAAAATATTATSCSRRIDIDEAVELTQLAFHLADRWRNPVLIYGDFLLAHTAEAVEVAPLDFGAAAREGLGGRRLARRQRPLAQLSIRSALRKDGNRASGRRPSAQRLAAKHAAIAAAEPRFEAAARRRRRARRRRVRHRWRVRALRRRASCAPRARASATSGRSRCGRSRTRCCASAAAGARRVAVLRAERRPDDRRRAPRASRAARRSPRSAASRPTSPASASGRLLEPDEVTSGAHRGAWQLEPNGDVR